MGAVRQYTKRHKWTSEQVSILTAEYPHRPTSDLAAEIGLPVRTVQCKANWLGLVRQKPGKRTTEQVLEAKRRDMATRRAQNPEAAREYGRQFRAKNADRINAKFREDNQRRLFWGRALRIRGVTGFDLWRLWKRQRGKCALTGQKLDRTAEVDHKMPKVRGGSDAIENLQWTTKAANRAKRDMTDVEFLVLCRNVAEWVGERIAIVDVWPENETRAARPTNRDPHATE